ncbi:MAG: Bax inhibitor-1 family protein, partial [Streptococcaceae bacterium]|nr:Bax inhibitor-1 family protein [Streptococcaceae bacterium]
MQNMTQTMTLEKFFARIYAVMAMGVGLSAAVSFITLAFFPQNLRIFGTGAILAVWIIQMILVMALSGLTMKNSPMALPGFLVFSAFNGFTISFTLAFYDIGTITQAFLASALMFAGLAL